MDYTRRVGTNYRALYPKEFNSFTAAKQRCNGQNKYAVRWYQGIEVRFKSFREFLDHIGPKPEPSMQLDRIDSSGHYEPGNVRWVTVAKQQTNKRNVRLITWEGKTHSIPEWERIKGFKQNTLRMRITYLGWSVKRAFTAPVQFHHD